MSIEHPPPPDRTLPYSYRKLSGYIFQLYIYIRVGTRFLKEFPKVLHKNKSFLPSLIDKKKKEKEVFLLYNGLEYYIMDIEYYIRLGYALSK